MKITLELDEQQIDILLTHIEGMFSGHSHGKVRSAETLDQELNHATENWRAEVDDGSFDFEIVKIAPVYRQLLGYCMSAGSLIGSFDHRKDIFSFVEAVRAARL